VSLLPCILLLCGLFRKGLQGRSIDHLFAGDLFRVEEGHRFPEEGDKEDDDVFGGPQSEEVGQDHLAGDFGDVEEDQGEERRS